MKLNMGEKGFTLVEVLVSLAILSAIMVVLTAAVILLQRTSAQNTEWNVNLRQVQSVGHWISRDALMAQVVDTTPDDPDGFLTLSWTDWDNNSFNVEYFFDGTTLMRRLNGGAESLIAEYIVTAATTCDWDDDENRLTVIIRADLHEGTGRFVERTYEITPRSVASGG